MLISHNSSRAASFNGRHSSDREWIYSVCLYVQPLTGNVQVLSRKTSDFVRSLCYLFGNSIPEWTLDTFLESPMIRKKQNLQQGSCSFAELLSLVR